MWPRPIIRTLCVGCPWIESFTVASGKAPAPRCPRCGSGVVVEHGIKLRPAYPGEVR